MAPRTLVVANPKSRAGNVPKLLAASEAALREVLGPFELEWTRGPRDAERITREGVRAGVERVIVAGGDGTTSEVVTGLLSADLGGYAELGVLPFGTGGDLLRTLELPSDVIAAARRIASGSMRMIDAGRIRYRDRQGADCTGYFANITSLGISGLVTELVDRAPKALGGTASFLIGTLRALTRFRPVPLRLCVDGEVVHDGGTVLAVLANGRYFGGGMHVAPEARPDDGLIDIVLIPEVPLRRLLTQLPSLYRGTHLGLPEVGHFRGSRITAEGDGAPIEIDGESLGSAPVEVECLPGALRFVGCTS